MCVWCNGYLRRKWAQCTVFNCWMRLFAFHMVLILLRSNILVVIFFQTVVDIFIVVSFNNILTAVCSGLLQESLVYLGIEKIQSGKSFLKFNWWLNKAFKNYEDLIQIMALTFFSRLSTHKYYETFHEKCLEMNSKRKIKWHQFFSLWCFSDWWAGKIVTSWFE